MNRKDVADQLWAQAQIIDQVGDAVVAVDLTGRVIGWNRGAERLHGYTAEEMLGRPVWMLHPPEWHRFIEENIDVLWKKHKLEVEIETLHKSGRRFWIQIRLAVLRDAGGEIIGTIGAASDISERRQREESLRDTEERFRAAFETSPDSVTIDRLDGTCVAANEGFEVLTGYSRIESIGTNSTELDFWVEPARREAYIAHVLKFGQLSNWEIPIRRKDGHVRTMLVSAKLLTLNREPHILNIARDVTEWRQTQEALRKSERNIRSLFEAMNECVAVHEMVYDESGRAINYIVTDINSATEKMSGIKREDCIGKPITEVLGVAEPPFLDVYARVAQTGEPAHFSTYFTLLGKPFRVSAFSPERGRFAIVFEDISQHVEIHREKTRLEQQLRQAQKMEAVGQLAGGMAHDFNNLLTVVLGNLELAKSELDPRHSAQPLLTTIEQAARQATGVTRSLLTFSRKYHAEKKPLDLCRLVGEAGNLLGRVLPGLIELRIDPCSRGCPVWVNGDATQLQQVLLNLAVNARDAMPEGGVLRISTSRTDCDSPTPQGRARASGQVMAQIVVSDTGPGMPADTLGRIFEPFFTTKARGQGTGLGLAIVHGIIRDHGGQITVESEIGRGTAFTIHLPCTDGPKTIAEPTRTEQRSVKPACCGTVLLAEDNEAIRRLITRCLETESLKIIEAQDGAALLELYDRYRSELSLMIVDIDLPRVNGLTCLKRIRESGGLTPAIVITGSAAIELSQHPLPHTTLLRKPFYIPELVATINQMSPQTK